MTVETEPVEILLVEDDIVDVKALKRAFVCKRLANPVTVARDGIEALQILRGEAGAPPLKKPYIVLLDLNMPRMNGLEFLAALRADPVHKTAIVFALTTSRAEQEIAKAYSHNIAGYIVKSELGDGFLDVVETLECYWRLVDLPNGR